MHIQHNEECDCECHAPSNCLKLNELRKQAHDQVCRCACTKPPATAPSSMPHIHVHVGSSHRSHRCSHRHSSRHQSRHSQSDLSSAGLSSSSSSSSSSEDESDTEGESLPISDVLAVLDKKQPASQYLNYQAALAAKGIIYARSALDFPVDWYHREVQMPQGLIKPFLRQVEVMLRKRRQQNQQSGHHKRVRVDNENVDPVLLV